VRRRLLWVAPLRLGGFIGLWWVLSEGALEDLPLVLLFALAATAASLLLLPPALGYGRLRPLGVLQFIPFFLWGSLVSGLDVARHALSPKVSVTPGFLTLELRLRTQVARIAFVWAANLIPGTAGVELLEEHLVLHLLDRGQDTQVSERDLRRLEARVARMFQEERWLK
jgi:multicomponent Na+:H+ antiporter subunit E